MERLSQSFYRLLLAAYPAEFRQEYEREMLLVFRDLCREHRQSGLGLVRVWMRALLDLAQSAPRERLQNFRKGFDPLKTLKTITLALIIYAAVVIIGGKLLVSGRAHLPYALGAMLDSLMMIGIAFNFIALVLMTTKLLRPVKAVRAACIAVVFLLAAVLAFLPAEARPNGVAVTTMVLSLLFWFGAHRLWAQRREAALS
ncbi:MAG: hypothetical protein JO360_09885 [Acidobacteria bacterium]|nr:hypothetical protein [Acidobacteriota bacterium]